MKDFAAMNEAYIAVSLLGGHIMMVLINSISPQTHLRELVFRLGVCLEPALLSRLSVLLRFRIVAPSTDMHGMSTSSFLHSGLFQRFRTSSVGFFFTLDDIHN